MFTGRRLRNLTAALGAFRTPMRVIVFESDDWGMDRMTPTARAALIEQGLLDPTFVFGKCGRESVEDLRQLYGVLDAFSDADGRHPVITMNFVMANPDYPAIEASGFQTYAWVPLDDPACGPEGRSLLEAYHDGIKRGLVCPQYHGRDHFSAETWLDEMQAGDPVAQELFRLRVPRIALGGRQESEYTRGVGATFEPLPADVITAKVVDGLGIFGRIFGHESLTTIAGCYSWCDEAERALYAQGVRCVQAAGHRVLPVGGGRLVHPELSFVGMRSHTRMRQLIRNARFEPSQQGEEAVERCLEAVGAAFDCGYPATIDTHRVNYSSCIDSAMRDQSLRLLGTLLKRLLAAYPDVRFVSSEDLARAVTSGMEGKGGPGSSVPIVRGGAGRRLWWVARERARWWREKRARSSGHAGDAT